MSHLWEDCGNDEAAKHSHFSTCYKTFDSYLAGSSSRLEKYTIYLCFPMIVALSLKVGDPCSKAYHRFPLKPVLYKDNPSLLLQHRNAVESPDNFEQYFKWSIQIC